MNAALQDSLNDARKALLEFARDQLDAVDGEPRAIATGIDDRGLYINVPVVEDHDEAAVVLVDYLLCSPGAWKIFENAGAMARALVVPTSAYMRLYFCDNTPIPPVMLQSDSYGSMRRQWLVDHMEAWTGMWLYFEYERSTRITDRVASRGIGPDGGGRRPLDMLWSDFASWCDGLGGVEVDEHAKRDLQGYVLDGVRPPSGDESTRKLEALFVVYIRMYVNGSGRYGRPRFVNR